MADNPQSTSTAAQVVIAKLERAVSDATEQGVGELEAGAALLAVTGEALGVLRATGDISVQQLVYDFARLAGMAGDTPDDFATKAQR